MAQSRKLVPIWLKIRYNSCNLLLWSLETEIIERFIPLLSSSDWMTEWRETQSGGWTIVGRISPIPRAKTVWPLPSFHPCICGPLEAREPSINDVKIFFWLHLSPPLLVTFTLTKLISIVFFLDQSKCGRHLQFDLQQQVQLIYTINTNIYSRSK